MTFSLSIQEKGQNSAWDTGIFKPTRHSSHVIVEGFPKYYINNPLQSIYNSFNLSSNLSLILSQ